MKNLLFLSLSLILLITTSFEAQAQDEFRQEPKNGYYLLSDYGDGFEIPIYRAGRVTSLKMAVLFDNMADAAEDDTQIQLIGAASQDVIDASVAPIIDTLIWDDGDGETVYLSKKIDLSDEIIQKLSVKIVDNGTASDSSRVTIFLDIKRE